MLLSKLGKIENGRMIKKTKDEAGDAHIRRISDIEYQVIVEGKVVGTYKGDTAKQDAEEDLKHRVGDAYEPTAPKNIAAAKKMSVAQGKAATGDKKTKDSFYDVFAKRDGQRQKFNNKPLAQQEADELVEYINKASIPSVEKGSAERVLIMDSKTKDGYEFVAKYKDWEVFRNEQTQTFPYIAYDKNANTIKGFSLVEIKDEIDKKGK